MKKISVKNLFITILLAVFIAADCNTFTQAAEKASSESFSVIVLPDTQIYAESFPDNFYKQTEWIRNNIKELNIKFVIHVGDITNKNSEAEWQVADKAYNAFRGAVPYAVVRGNHDVGPNGNAATRESEGFDKYFPASNVEKEKWFGGKMGENLANAWYKLDADKTKFLILCLDIQPTDEMLEWAGGVLEKNNDRQAIIVTHAYLLPDGNRIKGGLYPCGANDGENIWEKLVSKYENVFLVLCGHAVPSANSVAEGKNGNKVHQVMSDYQDLPEGGQGWLRIMEFNPTKKKIFISTYSPVLDKFIDDAKNKFEFDWVTEKEAVGADVKN